MISDKMSKLLERSAAMSAMYTESARMKEQYGVENVYDFGMGNPNLAAPDSIREVSIKVLNETDPWYLHHYMPNNGFIEAREKIANSLNRRFGETYGVDNIMMCVGAAGGINCLLKVLMDPGQEILTFAPYFGEYDRYADNVNCTLKAVPPNLPTFQPDPAELAKCVTEKTKAVLINNPNNPTGVVYSAETLRAIAEVLEAKEKEFGHAIYLISDEPYRELVFDGVTVPWVPDFYQNTIVAYSFSKSLSLPGDRIGYLALRNEVEDFQNIVAAVAVATRIMGFINAPGMQQLVCAELCEELVDVSFYDRNRERLYSALIEYGYECVKPEGAFYMFLKTPVEDDKEFVNKAKEHRILVTAGSGFGCPGYVRLAYCVSPNTIEGALPGFKALMEYYKKK
ncbi:MAG: pyridoxal phosphate-dependent aminotransferase [Anaerotignum sp.]|nr:pyridoxal phosphate-dependent aminotransferase [Anaerotignum sp.]